MDLAGVIKLIGETGGLLGLAIFAIWMLRRADQQRTAELKATLEAERDLAKTTLERERADRVTLVDAINRNTQAWVLQTQSMATMAEAMSTLALSLSTTRDQIHDIRILLAERPCLAPTIAEEIRRSEKK